MKPNLSCFLACAYQLDLDRRDLWAFCSWTRQNNCNVCFLMFSVKANMGQKDTRYVTCKNGSNTFEWLIGLLLEIWFYDDMPYMDKRFLAMSVSLLAGSCNHFLFFVFFFLWIDCLLDWSFQSSVGAEPDGWNRSAYWNARLLKMTSL